MTDVIELINSPAILGVIAAIPIGLGVYLTFKSSGKMDATANQAAEVSRHGSLVEGFSAFATQLQDAYNRVSARLDACEEMKAEYETRIGELERVNGKQEEASL